MPSFKNKLSAIIVIILIHLVFINGCTSVRRYNSQREIEKLPFCPKKIKISPGQFKSDFHSILIFYEDINFLMYRQGTTSNEIFDPLIQELKDKGYVADLGHKIDYNALIDEYHINLECRHCGNFEEDSRYDRELAKKCLLVDYHYAEFFKNLMKKYPETSKYEMIADIDSDPTRDRTGSFKTDFKVYVFNVKKQILILENSHSEWCLSDIHKPPQGYNFVKYPKSEIDEGQLSCTLRGLDGIFSIFPNISGKPIKKESTILPRAFIYKHQLNGSLEKTEIKADTIPDYWIFEYSK